MTTPPKAGLWLERHITASASEFARQVYTATRYGMTVGGELPQLQIADDRCALTLVVWPMSDLVVASIRLPRIRVEYCGKWGDLGAQTALLARLEHCLQRGGG